MPDPLSLISVRKCVYFWSPPSCGHSRVPLLLRAGLGVCVCLCVRGVMEAEGPWQVENGPGLFI